jgi:hypothetical protein
VRVGQRVVDRYRKREKGTILRISEYPDNPYSVLVKLDSEELPTNYKPSSLLTLSGKLLVREGPLPDTSRIISKSEYCGKCGKELKDSRDTHYSADKNVWLCTEDMNRLLDIKRQEEAFWLGVKSEDSTGMSN